MKTVLLLFIHLVSSFCFCFPLVYFSVNCLVNYCHQIVVCIFFRSLRTNSFAFRLCNLLVPNITLLSIGYLRLCRGLFDESPAFGCNNKKTKTNKQKNNNNKHLKSFSVPIKCLVDDR